MYKDVIEKVIGYFAADHYSSEFAQAREEYFGRTGKVFEDDPAYEGRMTAFLEWYLFDRNLPHMGISPIRLYFLIHRSQMTEDQKEMMETLQNTTHSLFEMISQTPELLRVKNLFSGEIVSVETHSNYAAVEKGDIIDSRYIPFKSIPVFSDAVWVHPTDARKFIVGEIERLKLEGRPAWANFMFDLSYMKLKLERYKHLTASQIYTWESFRKETTEPETSVRAG